MTLEIFQLLDEVDRAAEVMAKQSQDYGAYARAAVALLNQFSNQLPALEDKLDLMPTDARKKWRGAEPAGEPIGQVFDPPADIPPAQHIIATDGSQIFPDRHGIAHYALVNIGAIHFRPGSGEPPETVTRADLLYGERLQDEENEESLQAADISRERDKQELSCLIELSAAQDSPAVALMDSPLLLWILGEPGQRGELEKWFVDQLRAAQAAGILLAGYVDRPGSRGVSDLLALATASDEQIQSGKLPANPFKQMPDRAIFRRVLEPGQRSALFISSSPFNPILKGHGEDLQIAFFYLNVGGPGDPAIARVETPCWVANDPVRLGRLHAAIWEQCQAPGRYPYVLARAHEIAVVNMEQRNELENILAGAMLARGLTPSTSAKSFLKTLTAG